MKRLLALGTVAVATVGALVLGFALGQNQTVSDRKAITALRAELQQSQAHIAELEAAVVDAELRVSVQTTAAHALRQNLTDMHDKNAVVIEELTFYKSLMAPSSLPQGLQISELVIESTAVENSFRFQLLLTQVAKRRSYISGEVSIDVIGHFVGAQDVEGGALAHRTGRSCNLSSAVQVPLFSRHCGLAGDPLELYPAARSSDRYAGR